MTNKNNFYELQPGTYKCEVHYFTNDPNKGTVNASLELKNIVPLPQVSIRQTLSGRKKFDWAIICSAKVPAINGFLQESLRNLSTEFQYKWFIDWFEITTTAEGTK